MTDVNTISIPTDVILMLSLLIVFALLGYFFHNILDNQTSQFVEKVDDNLNLELVKEKIEDQLILESKIVHSEKVEEEKNKKLNILPLSKLLGIRSLAIVAIGGSSLFGIQNIQNSYKSVANSQVNFKTENESAKSILPIARIKSSNQSQTKIKKISYVDPLLSTKNSSYSSNLDQVQARQTGDFFSFWDVLFKNHKHLLQWDLAINQQVNNAYGMLYEHPFYSPYQLWTQLNHLLQT